MTTAASIWTTAAIGILVGIGFYFPAIVGAVIVLVVLALFRFIESKLPSEYDAHHLLRFERASVMNESDVRTLIGSHGFSIANLSSRLADDGKFFEFRMTIRSRDSRATERLGQHLRGLPDVIEFRITPAGDESTGVCDGVIALRRQMRCAAGGWIGTAGSVVTIY